MTETVGHRHSTTTNGGSSGVDYPAAADGELRTLSHDSDPLVHWTSVPWDEAVRRIHRACGRLLRRYPQVDPWDTTQDVLIQILRRDFATKFDSSRGNFWTFVNGIVRIMCARAIARECKQPPAEFLAVHLHRRVVDPTVVAEVREFLAALEDACAGLTVAEGAMLEYVLERAEGATPRRRLHRRVDHVRASRCRKRLRSALRAHAPRKR